MPKTTKGGMYSKRLRTTVLISYKKGFLLERYVTSYYVILLHNPFRQLALSKKFAAAFSLRAFKVEIINNYTIRLLGM